MFRYEIEVDSYFFLYASRKVDALTADLRNGHLRYASPIH